MKIITDNGLDLAPGVLDALDVEIVPLTISLDGQDYKGGVDITSQEFYEKVRASEGFPTTSQPSPGDFDQTYTRLIEHDPDMISIHMSAGLSGTVNAARLGAELTAKKGANVTVIDSKSASGALGWQVEVAARGAAAGWPRETIVDLVKRIGSQTRIIFTPATVKYLVHGGRVSHVQGFAANMLSIKPILQIDASGKIDSIGRVRTMRKAVAELANVIEREHGTNTPLRVQVEHADDAEMGQFAADLMSTRFQCEFLPMTSITPLIGAHVGPGLIGIVYAPLAAFDEVPGLG